MTYQVLARKLRPRTFEEVLGQDHVTTPLRNAIRSGRIPHAILLTGPRGTGKTTLARIFACCLNAEKGPTESPDPDDPACREIAQGTSTDVQEIDAASRTSVDDVRELIEAVRYAPSPGKYRIYIVDEVHMLSTAAFNALLKTLEEPPPRSLFVFCTTNPEKIPFTVVSRCQRYDLRRLPAADVATYLGQVARTEGISISEPSLLAIAQAGEGSLRDSLTLFDQLIAFGGQEIDDQQVAQVLDLIDRSILLQIVRSCVESDASAALTACRRAWEAGVDARRLGGAVLALLRDLVVLRVAPDADGLVEVSDAELATLCELASRADETRLRRMFRALLKEQEDLAWAPEPFAVLEMAVIRLATLPAADEIGRLVARLESLERRLRSEAAGGAGGPGGGGAGRGGEPPAPAPRPGGRRRGAAQALPAQSPPPAAPEAEPRDAAAPAPTAVAGERTATPGGGDGSAEPLAGGGAAAPLAVVFDRLRAAAWEEDRMLGTALEGGRLVERDEGRLRIALPSGVAARRLEARRPQLEALCTRLFGPGQRIEFEAAGAPPPPALAAPAGDAEDARTRRQEALEHPAVNAALEILHAEILEIRPLGPGSAS